MRIMGYIAGLNASLSRQSVNFIPMNWGLIGASLVMAGVLGQIGWRDRDPQAIPYVVPAFLIGVTFLIATLKRNTFFRPQGAAAPASARLEADLEQMPLHFTGHLRLHEKEARRFLDVPAAMTRLEDGSLAFVSSIDASTRFSGVVTKSKVGLWLSIPRFEAPQFECGTLYFGKAPRPALRFSHREGADAKNKAVTTILSFDSPLDRDAMRDFLTAQGASKAASISVSPFSSGPVR
jgi:hypothetical protein